MPGDALNALSMRRFANRGFPASVTLCGTWENLQLELFRMQLTVSRDTQRTEKGARQREHTKFDVSRQIHVFSL